MKLHRCLPVVLLIASLPPAAAQTATWIAPGTVSFPDNRFGSWDLTANWDTGLVPNASGALAIVNQSTNGGFVTPVPGGAQPVVLGDITVGELRFALPPNGSTQFTGLYVGSPFMSGPITYPTGHLRLDGAGITISAAGTSAFTYVDLHVQPGSLFDFAQQATVTKSGFTFLRLNITGTAAQPAMVRFFDDASPGAFANQESESYFGGPVYWEFHDRSTASSTSPRAYKVDFFDQSTAAQAVLQFPVGSASAGLTFHDQSTAGQAQISTRGGPVTFTDSANAGSATISPTIPFAISPRALEGSFGADFKGNSSAASAQIFVNRLTFSDRATAASAGIHNIGLAEENSHGIYAKVIANLLFRDQSTAGNATINNGAYNSPAEIVFQDQSSAGSSTIESYGDITFGDSSVFANARVIARSGLYPVTRGFNLPPDIVATGTITFKDQAAGGPGRIEIASADAIIDFSGLKTAAGTTGRAVLAGPPAAPAVVADDGVAFTLGAITNTTPGGTLYLGSTVLSLGADNSDMVLSARISDVGGRFGSLAGKPLTGGGFAKVGTGTLTVTNPDNNYTGFTHIAAGAVNLSGGSITGTTLAGMSRLTGSGTVRGPLLNGLYTLPPTNTVVSPGNSIGTITVQNTYIQGPGGTLNMEVASVASYDRLVVGGSAFLAGTLNLSLLNGYVPVGNTSLDFLTSGDIRNKFDIVNLPSGMGAALSPSVVYAGDRVSLQVMQLSFGGFAGGLPATAALGAYLDATLATATGDYHNLIAGLNTLGATDLSAALGALAPDRYAVLAEHGHLTAAAQRAALDRRLAAWRTDASRGFELFFEAGHRSADFDAVAGLPDAKSTASHGTVGGAWRNGAFSLGASLAQETGDLDLDALGSRADLEGLTPAVFLQYAGDRFFLNAAAAFSRDDYDLRRRIVYSGYDQTAVANTSGRRTDLALTAGYAFRSGSWTLAPQLGLLHSDWVMGDLREAGAAGADLDISGWSTRSLRTRVGFEAGRAGPVFSPRLALSWLHETRADRSLPVAFVDATGAPYTAPGRPAGRNLVQAALGFDWQLGKRIVFHATLAGAWSDNARLASDLSAGFRWTF